MKKPCFSALKCLLSYKPYAQSQMPTHASSKKTKGTLLPVRGVNKTLKKICEANKPVNVPDMIEKRVGTPQSPLLLQLTRTEWEGREKINTQVLGVVSLLPNPS